MKVRAITWGAVRVGAQDVEPMRALGSLLGLQPLAESPDVAMLATADGDVIEFCGPAHPTPPHLFERQEMVMGFRVDDVDAASAELAAGGIELVGEIQRADDGLAFCHFRGPDGRVYGLIAGP